MMTSRKANRAVIRGQLKGAAISVMDALNEELNAGMPAGQLRDAAESLRALAEVLGQMESVLGADSTIASLCDDIVNHYECSIWQCIVNNSCITNYSTGFLFTVFIF